MISYISAVLLLSGVFGGANAYTRCGGTEAVDLVFLLDETTWVDEKNFNKTKRFTEDIVKSFAINPEKTQVGYVTYAGSAYTHFNISELKTKTATLEGIAKVGYCPKGNKKTYLGIQELEKRLFLEK
eukprot:Selendium_serpulae@DN6200_c2_g4_i1.p1